MLRRGTVWMLVGLVGAAACGTGERRETAFVNNPILGGELVEEGDYMEVVLILANIPGDYSFMCTGTLISKRVVLTAAHCLDHEDLQPDGVVVRFGFSVGDSVRVRASEFLIHPNYSEAYLRNDIGLIRIERAPPVAVQFAPHLPKGLQITETDIGTDLLYVGFGVNDLGTDGVKVWMTHPLQWVCTRAGGCNPGQRYTICIDQEQTGICSGDSGGPAFIERDGRRYVAGVNSYTGYNPDTGQSCIWFGCSTKVDEFQEFIDDFVGDPDGTPCELDEDCASMECSDGVCCAEDCDGRCMDCSLPGLAGTCVPVSDGIPCLDSNLCNGDEICLAGECLAGEPLACSDEVECTKNLCDPKTGCVFQPSTVNCFDDNPCTRDWCDAQEGCWYEDYPDGSICGLNSENSECQAGQCVELPAEEDCGCGAGVPSSGAWLLLVAMGLFFRARRRQGS